MKTGGEDALAMAREVRREASQAGITLSIRGGRLKWSGRKSEMTEALSARIFTVRVELITLLEIEERASLLSLAMACVVLNSSSREALERFQPSLLRAVDEALADAERL